MPLVVRPRSPPAAKVRIFQDTGLDSKLWGFWFRKGRRVCEREDVGKSRMVVCGS